MVSITIWIEIIDMPEGEAPEWVRKEWIGLKLPLFYGASPNTCCRGVVTWDKVPCGSGYNVLVIDALKILSLESPEAVKWWKEESIYKEVGIEGGLFIFNEKACEIIN